MFADVAANGIDDEVGKLLAILDLQIIAVEVEKIVGGGEGGAFVALKERVIATDAEQQRHRQRHNVAFAIMPVVDRARDRAFEAGGIAKDVWLAGLGYG